MAISNLKEQEQVFDKLRHNYPQDQRRFVILSMDMADEHMKAGRTSASFKEQLAELAELKAKYPDEILPFIAVDPRRENVGDLVKEYVEQQTGRSFDGLGLAWREATVVGEFIFIVRNDSDQELNVYPDQGTVQIGERKIGLTWISWPLSELDDVSGKIPADAVRVGGFWYPITRLTMADVVSVTLRFNAAHDSNFDPVGNDYTFAIDLSDLPNEPIDDSVTTP